VWGENKGAVVCMVVPKPGKCIKLEIVHNEVVHACCTHCLYKMVKPHVNMVMGGTDQYVSSACWYARVVGVYNGFLVGWGH
jgi:hypothetical protein